MPEWLLTFLTDYGYWFIFLVVFLNNAGFPIPGDVTALGGGVLVQNGNLSLWSVVTTAAVACFLGGTFSYGVGKKLGRGVLERSRWMRMTPERLDQTERFFKKHGPKVVFFARFVALVHPITGLLAGVGKMPFRPFLIYNLAGSFAYALSYTLAGYFFGASWDVLKVWVGRGALYFLLVVLVLFFFSRLLRDPLHQLMVHWSRRG